LESLEERNNVIELMALKLGIDCMETGAGAEDPFGSIRTILDGEVISILSQPPEMTGLQ
jgi:hypothetical protein